MYSMIASRTRHCLSSASCTIAGSKDCESSSMPITVIISMLAYVSGSDRRTFVD